MERVVILHAPADAAGAQACKTHLAPLRRSGMATVETVETDAADAVLEATIALVILSAPLVEWWLAAPIVAGVQGRHEAGLCHMVPVRYRFCDLTASWLARWQTLPRDGKPIAEMAYQDAAWTEVAKAVREALAKRAAA